MCTMHEHAVQQAALRCEDLIVTLQSTEIAYR